MVNFLKLMHKSSKIINGVNNNYIYIKCEDTKVNTVKIDVSSLNRNASVYVYKLDINKNPVLVKIINAYEVSNNNQSIEVNVEKDGKYIISDNVLTQDGKVKNTVLEMYKEGWNKIGNLWIFVKNGQIIKGWFKDKGKWYYTNRQGIMQIGWVQYNGKWYYLNSDGSMAENTTVYGYKVGSDGALIQ